MSKEGRSPEQAAAEARGRRQAFEEMVAQAKEMHDADGDGSERAKGLEEMSDYFVAWAHSRMLMTCGPTAKAEGEYHLNADANLPDEARAALVKVVRENYAKATGANEEAHTAVDSVQWPVRERNIAMESQPDPVKSEQPSHALAVDEKYARIGRMVVDLVKDYDLNKLVVQLSHQAKEIARLKRREAEALEVCERAQAQCARLLIDMPDPQAPPSDVVSEMAHKLPWAPECRVQAPPAEAPMPRLERWIEESHKTRIVHRVQLSGALVNARADLADAVEKAREDGARRIAELEDEQAKLGKLLAKKIESVYDLFGPIALNESTRWHVIDYAREDRNTALEKERDNYRRQAEEWQSAHLRACQDRDKNAQAAREFAELRSRLEQWCRTFDTELCPPRADSYGEGVRDSKDKVFKLLHLDQPEANPGLPGIGEDVETTGNYGVFTGASKRRVYKHVSSDAFNTEPRGAVYELRHEGGWWRRAEHPGDAKGGK
jgi:hypothetical protein